MSLYTFLRGIITAIIGWLCDIGAWIAGAVSWQPLTVFSEWLGGLITNDLTINLLTILAGIILVLAVSFINLIIVMWFELKLFARFYHGRGPTEVGYAGLLQNIAHGMKLFLKELILPKKVDKWAYLIAPSIYIGTSFAAFAVIPWTEGFHIGPSEPKAGFLIIFALFALAPFMIFVSGWASNNKYSLIGGMRSASQLISYEVPLLFSVLGVIIFAQSLAFSDIVHSQAEIAWLRGMLPGWFIFVQPLGAVLFFTAIIAELERIPFDLPEAEAELVEGWKTEYGGIRFGLLMFTEWARGVVACSLFVLLFLGGWQGPFTDMRTTVLGYNVSTGAFIGIFWFFLKVYLVFSVMVWIRASLPRIRVDQLLRICWNVLLPLSVINLFLSVAAFIIWQQYGFTLCAAFSLISFCVIALYFLLKKPAAEKADVERIIECDPQRDRAVLSRFYHDTVAEPKSAAKGVHDAAER